MPKRDTVKERTTCDAREIVFCPLCRRLAEAKHGQQIEGKTRAGTPIALCKGCSKTPREKIHRDLPGQQVLNFT